MGPPLVWSTSAGAQLAALAATYCSEVPPSLVQRARRAYRWVRIGIVFRASWFGWGFRPDGAAWLRPTHAVSGRGRISFSTRSLRRLCAQSVRHAPAHCLYTVPPTAWCHSSPARLCTGCGRAASMPSYSRYPALVIVSSAPIRIRRPKPASKHFGGRWCSWTKCCNRGVDPYRPFVNPVADSTTPAAGPRHADGGTAAATLRSSTR